MGVNCLFILYAVALVHLKSVSLQEYKKDQVHNPQIIFESIDIQDSIENTPQFQKIMFITPWNKKGSSLVVKHAHKFDYVSPCWYDLILKQQTPQFQNDKLYDSHFIDQLKQANPNIKILPRIYLSPHQQSLVMHIGSLQSNFNKLLKLIITLINNESFKFDGLVWDSPFNTFVNNQRQMPVNDLFMKLANAINKNLKPNKLIFFNMGNPISVSLSERTYQQLEVDAILIQNYDTVDNFLSQIQASNKWIQKVKFKNQPTFFFLLPFFSRRSNQPVSGQNVLQNLLQNGIGHSSYEKGMCKFIQSNTQAISYVPCYHYFKRAFDMVKAKGVGFWEGGNGFQNYYHFL